ncbi:AAA family ATPase [Dactylosporangium sp. McL0621]|uniref:AAA family ATPase n=1 Tax=Dactylosporangium sp. McL0621 TaxID=3415678 RepID=UPI003CF26744
MTAAPAVYLITGIPASGKSTVAQALAERLPRSVHLRGDAFRRMVVNGRADMTPAPSAEAAAQLALRHRLTAGAADPYHEAGFTVVAQDVVLGAHLPAMVAAIRARPLFVVVLAPTPSAVAARESGRAKSAYDPHGWTAAPAHDPGRESDRPKFAYDPHGRTVAPAHEPDRESDRPKSAYDQHGWTVESLDAELRERTPRIGLWLDTSDQSPPETVDAILARARPFHD